MDMAKKVGLWLGLVLILLFSMFVLGEQFEVSRLAAKAVCEGKADVPVCMRNKGFLATHPFYPDLTRRTLGAYARLLGGDLGATYYEPPPPKPAAPKKEEDEE